MAGFYAKACAEAEVNGQKMPDSRNYSYMNTNLETEEAKAFMGLPWRKEVVLVSIADFCEAAIRSCMQTWEMPSCELIYNKVVELIQERLKEHQFDKARIQINELNIVIRTLVDVFCSKYHLRPQYETTEELVSKLMTQRALEVPTTPSVKQEDKQANDANAEAPVATVGEAPATPSDEAPASTSGEEAK
jgi:hypothetical protein